MIDSTWHTSSVIQCNIAHSEFGDFNLVPYQTSVSITDVFPLRIFFCQDESFHPPLSFGNELDNKKTPDLRFSLFMSSRRKTETTEQFRRNS